MSLNNNRQPRKAIAMTIAALLQAVAVLPDADAQHDGGYGLVPEDPIEVCKPEGQDVYLQRLACPDGNTPASFRVGSIGERTDPETMEEEDLAWDQADSYEPLAAGVTDFHMLDMYTVECGDDVYALYFDMYHCGQLTPEQAPPGLDLVPPQADDGASLPGATEAAHVK